MAGKDLLQLVVKAEGGKVGVRVQMHVPHQGMPHLQERGSSESSVKIIPLSKALALVLVVVVRCLAVQKCALKGSLRSASEKLWRNQKETNN